MPLIVKGSFAIMRKNGKLLHCNHESFHGGKWYLEKYLIYYSMVHNLFIVYLLGKLCTVERK